MNIWACVAWRGDAGQRTRNFAYVQSWLDKAEIQIVTADAGGDTFNRGASRNMAAEEAIGNGADVLLFHDADMVVPHPDYYQIGETCRKEHRYVVGFTVYRALTPAATRQVLAGTRDPFTAQSSGVLTNFSVGGITAMLTQDFLDVGGFDTRFTGWGCEDFAFKIATERVLGSCIRTSNVAAHLWHPHGHHENSLYQNQHNARLLNAYSATQNLAELRALQTSEDYVWHG